MRIQVDDFAVEIHRRGANVSSLPLCNAEWSSHMRLSFRIAIVLVLALTLAPRLSVAQGRMEADKEVDVYTFYQGEFDRPTFSLWGPRLDCGISWESLAAARCAGRPWTVKPVTDLLSGNRCNYRGYALVCFGTVVLSANEKGWFYLGKTDLEFKAWTASSAIGTFVIDPSREPVRVGESIGQSVDNLVGRTIQTTSTKYLRSDGYPYERVRSALKKTLPRGTVLRIIAIEKQKALDAGEPVIWAEVEVQESK